MAVHPGRHLLGAGQGRIRLLTTRDGLVAQAGHDLTIEVRTWSADLQVTDDFSVSELTVRADLTSLVVLEGKGGVKPLTERDKREIAVTARKVIGTDRHPGATFSATRVEIGADGGGVIHGSLTIAGTSRPWQLQVSPTGPGSYHATARVQQSDFGIKPYTAFLGTLKVSDAIGVEIDVDLTDRGQDDTDGKQR